MTLGACILIVLAFAAGVAVGYAIKDLFPHKY